MNENVDSVNRIRFVRPLHRSADVAAAVRTAWNHVAVPVSSHFGEGDREYVALAGEFEVARDAARLDPLPFVQNPSEHTIAVMLVIHRDDIDAIEFVGVDADEALRLIEAARSFIAREVAP